ncbi:MAG: pentapeptide repeat-containing protein, partial [FCB group bacterium]|nr:pentapeptide repeat-containing protein [FCB group bacterium]
MAQDDVQSSQTQITTGININGRELKAMFNSHRTWLNSKEEKGKQALLCKYNLRGIDFTGFGLSRVNLTGADLTNSHFGEEDLTGTVLKECILRNADLSKVKSLQGYRLAGADLSGARLPEYTNIYDGLKVIDEACRNVKRLFHVILAFCIYSWLTIANTTDIDLLTNSPSSPLPIIKVSIPTASFFIAVSSLLVCIYIYFHLNLQRLWERLSEMPAVFPDGHALDEKAYPWLIIGLTRNYTALLRKSKRLFPHLQKNIS